MKRICNISKIDKVVNNAVFRHSFAAITKRLGATTEYVQDYLGHAVKATTEIYRGGYSALLN
ncbi:tyrosine-type recombinase/integrase [Niabella sp. 22666]|uniref:tyrosine-type recombinase/integrase n=1 Tax=Niabella sp. 22666 TaxID=3453954 RepID=UPI003F868101